MFPMPIKDHFKEDTCIINDQILMELEKITCVKNIRLLTIQAIKSSKLSQNVCVIGAVHLKLSVKMVKWLQLLIIKIWRATKEGERR